MARNASTGAAGSKKQRAEKKLRVPGAKAAAAKHGNANRSKADHQPGVAEMRSLAHDLSNALEAILQAAYLLGQSKLEDGPRRWAQLIDSSSQEAARLNREIRKLLRALNEQ